MYISLENECVVNSLIDIKVRIIKWEIKNPTLTMVTLGVDFDSASLIKNSQNPPLRLPCSFL